jgi:predicted solute-binding protein
MTKQLDAERQNRIKIFLKKCKKNKKIRRFVSTYVNSLTHDHGHKIEITP